MSKNWRLSVPTICVLFTENSNNSTLFIAICLEIFFEFCQKNILRVNIFWEYRF
jgi:hypothetical protein